MRRFSIGVLFSVALGLASAVCAQRAEVLFLTQSAGFTHPVVKRAQRAKLAFAEKQLRTAAAGQFDVVCSQDASSLDAASLRRYAAVVFYTTGELPMEREARAALLAWVRGGGALIGVHSATDTFYQWPAYGEMIGGYFDGHPWNEKVRLRVENRTHPATVHLGDTFEIADEIYQFRDFSRERVRVLLSVDPKSVAIERGKRADRDYALAWCRDYGKGRVFYTALGHRPAVWKDRRFQKHLIAGIRWAIHDEAVLSRPPQGATVLFDGKGFDAWRAQGRREIGWEIADGAMRVVPGKGSIMTRERYQSFRMHLEFRIPKKPKGNGNSGVYLQRRYEVQILDSSGRDKLRRNDCGALYRQRVPDVNVFGGTGEWQSYDITFDAAKFDEAGTKTGNARITVLQNGVVIHDAVELKAKTGAGMKEGPEARPILLQDHGCRVAFRNIWIVRR